MGRRAVELDADMLLFLEKLQYHDYRVELQTLAEELNLSRTAVYKRLNKLRVLRKTIGVRMELEIRNLLVGLGRILVIAKKEFAPSPQYIPGRHWLESYVRALDGKHVLLKYYYVLESGGKRNIRDHLSLSRREFSKIVFLMDASIVRGNRMSFVKYYDLVQGRIIIPWDELKERLVSKDVEPVYIAEKPRSKPNDLMDLILIANLQRDPFISLQEIARRYTTRLYNIKTCFTEHLYKPGVLGGFFGFSFLIDRRERLVSYSILRFPDRESMMKFIAASSGRPPVFTYNLPFDSSDNIMAVMAVMPLLDYPRYIQFLDYAVDKGVLEDYHLYHIAASRDFVYGHTIPYRNYDPFTQRWILDERQLDEITTRFASLLERTGIIKKRRRA